MFDFSQKDLENLYCFKIKNSLDDVPLPSNYCFIYNNKMLFIKKSRDYYRLCASPILECSPVVREQVFDVIFQSKDLMEVVEQFECHIRIIIGLNI